VFTVVPASDTDALGAVVYAEDVTQRTAVEREEGRERLKLMIQHAEQVALALFEAPKGELLHASPRYLDLLERGAGVDPEDVAGRGWHELAFMPTGEEADAAFRRVVETGAPVRFSEVRGRSGLGAETVWDCSLIPIRTDRESRKVEFVLVSAVEVTEQVEARDELQRLDHLKDEFLSMASHELRTPLVPLTTYSELLVRMATERDKTPDWERRFAEMLEKLRRQLRHLSRMTDDLLDVGRLQSGKFNLQTRPVDLTALVAAVAEQAGEVQTPARKVEVVTDGSDELVVQGDEGRLTQVLMNLLENAFKYGDGAQDVAVRLSRSNDEGAAWVQVDVEDDGPGIPPGERRSLFTRFYQGARDGRPSRSGLGLGLYIARGIVEQHGGSIELDPTWTRGTRVRVRLPLASG
jgi:signal transduction histidine kinase